MKSVGMAGLLVAVLGMFNFSLAQPLDSTVPDSPNPHFYYEFEGDIADYADRLTLETGEIKIGKILEWGTLVYFWDRVTGKRYGYARDEVRGIALNRSEGILKKPALPDLTVAYIERLPRDQGWHGIVKYDTEGKKGMGVLMIDPADYPLHPEPGQEVTFIVHILNAGSVPSKPFSWSVWMDDTPLTSGRIEEPIEANGQRAVEVKWNWQEGQHYIKVLLDTKHENEEIAKWNNTFIDPVRALTFFFVIGGDMYRNFSNSRNFVDTFSFEDWVQYHVHGMNWLFENSIWPSAPQGILERVRVDKIVVVENYDDEEAKKKWDAERRFNNDPEGPIMFNGNWFFGNKDRDETAVAQWASRHDWGLPHELGHQLGLVDLYWANHGHQDVFVINLDGNYQNIMHFYPWPKMMMHWHGPHIFSEISAGYLNQTRGRPRGFFGDYYYQIPEKNFVKVISNTGRPLDGVEITLYQRWVDPYNTFIVGDWKCPWAYGPEPVFTGRTDKEGKYLLPNQKVTPHDTPEPGYSLRDNPWGQINVVGDNSLLLAKINYRGQEEFHWLRLHDANIGYLRGQNDEFTFLLSTRFAEEGTPVPPRIKPLWHIHPSRIDLTLMWEPSPSGDIVEYRCYHRISHGDHSVKPFRLFNIISTDKIRDGKFYSHADYWKDPRPDQGHYGGDSYFAVTAVDSKGRESALSEVIPVPNWSANNVNVNKVAIAPDGRFYISINANDIQMLVQDAEGVKKEVGFRDVETPRPLPKFGGIAFDRHGNIVAAHTWSDEIGIWNTAGDKVFITGEKGTGEGQFTNPSDVAIDSRGRIYVADTGNSRIQIFDGELNYTGQFGSKGDGEMQFEEPVALGIVGDVLAVTDRKLNRVLVFDVSGDEPVQTREPGKVSWLADRALVAPSGNIYVAEMAGIVIYGADGSIVQKIEGTPEGRVFQPRGLCYDGEGGAVFVNSLPLANVMRIEIK